MSGRVIKETLALIQDKIPNLGEIRVKRVCIGLGYTAVRLDTGHAGICYTHQSEIAPRCCHIVERAGTLAGSSAFQLADLCMHACLSSPRLVFEPILHQTITASLIQVKQENWK